VTSSGRVLVTGATGFVGGHLARELAGHGFEVVGAGMGEPDDELGRHLTAYLDHDLTRTWPAVGGLTHVVHLAALSAVGPSFDAPQEYLTTNAAMVVNLGEQQLAAGVAPRTLVVSSGAVYDPDQSLPIAEDGVLRLGSPYAVSKVLVENLAAYYVERGLDWVVARPFNHIGPGQGGGFLLPDLYAGCRAALAGDGVLEVGDLTTRRDYSDVRDVVRAYRLLLQVDAPGHRLYNVCSGRDASGEEILDVLRRQRFGDHLTVRLDPSRLRPTDARRVVGDSSRLAAETGWAPAIPLEASIGDFLAAEALARPR
jgi:GDP-4-dehydro-6-deoxy-D-mannose reductase